MSHSHDSETLLTTIFKSKVALQRLWKAEAKPALACVQDSRRCEECSLGSRVSALPYPPPAGYNLFDEVYPFLFPVYWLLLRLSTDI